MRKTKLRKKGKSPIAQCKARIQHLLTAIVRLRDGGCIFRFYDGTGKCGGITAADHIISRQIAATYGLTDNVVCACWCHHKFFKEKFPTFYTQIVKEVIGTKTYNKIHKLAENSQPKSLKEWLEVEKNLQKIWNKLNQAKEQPIAF